MPFAVNDFVATLKLDGARTNYFEVHVTNPVSSVADNILPILCRAAALPESNINVIRLPYAGRSLTFAGVRPPLQDWTITVINDEGFEIRNALETWHNYINSMRTNLRKFNTAAPSEYKSVATVSQYSKTGEVIRVYQMLGLWPSAISSIRVSYDEDAIQNFDVTFSYDWYEVVDGVTGNGGGAS